MGSEKKVTILAVLVVLVLSVIVAVQPVFACTAGCTPGFWKQKQHFWLWTDPYVPAGDEATLVGDVFAVPDDDLNGDGEADTLLDALKYKGGPGLDGAARILLRAAVATLLNSAYDKANNAGWAYSHWTVEFLQEKVNYALGNDRGTMLWWAGHLDNMNNLGCPL